MPVYEQGPCYNQNFGYDQPLYYSLSQPQQFHCCKVCGGPHYSSDCQTWNPLVYEPNPCSNYDLPYFDQPPQYHIDDSPPQDLDLKNCIDNLKLQMNEIIKWIREIYQIHEPPISFDEPGGSNDDTEYAFNLPPLPCTDVLGDTKVDIDLPFGENLDTLSTGDREIDFNPSDLETIDPVPDPMMFDVPLGNDDSISRSFNVTISNPLFDFDDNYSLIIDNKNFDDDFEDLCSLDPLKSIPLIDESILLVTPLPDPKQICLREVERFDPFFSLTQSGDMTWVMERPSYIFPYMPLPHQVAYSPKVVMYRYFHLYLILSDGCVVEPRIKYKGLKTKQKRYEVRGVRDPSQMIGIGRYEVWESEP
ncbi:hypothetical protein Tco_0722399 [Tanacetum coccineum]